MNPPNDCRTCGVCCFSDLDAYVRVTGADWSRLGELAESVAYFSDNRAFMRMVDGHCAALALRKNTDGGMEFFCTVYERRPKICRDLDRGSPECEGERAAKSSRVSAVVNDGKSDESPRRGE